MSQEILASGEVMTAGAFDDFFVSFHSDGFVNDINTKKDDDNNCQPHDELLLPGYPTAYNQEW
jgi:hypothetical protein